MLSMSGASGNNPNLDRVAAQRLDAGELDKTGGDNRGHGPDNAIDSDDIVWSAWEHVMEIEASLVRSS